MTAKHLSRPLSIGRIASPQSSRQAYKIFAYFAPLCQILLFASAKECNIFAEHAVHQILRLRGSTSEEALLQTYHSNLPRSQRVQKLC